MEAYSKYFPHLIFKVILICIYHMQYIKCQTNSIPSLTPLTVVNTPSAIYGYLLQLKIYSQYIVRYSDKYRVDIWKSDGSSYVNGFKAGYGILSTST